MSSPVGIKLEEYPGLIADKSTEVLRLKEYLKKIQDGLAAAEIEIEREVLLLDKKAYPNEAARDVYRHDRKALNAMPIPGWGLTYQELLKPVNEQTIAVKQAEIELQYLRDSFSVAKLQLQDAIASAA